MPKRKIDQVTPTTINDAIVKAQNFSEALTNAVANKDPSAVREAWRIIYQKAKLEGEGDIQLANLLERENGKWIPQSSQDAIVDHFQRIMDHIGTLNTQNPLIFVETELGSAESTHHKGIPAEGEDSLDPYLLYQADGSHGFCQTFALMIATGDKLETLEAKEDTDDSVDKFIKQANNSIQAYYYALTIVPKQLRKLSDVHRPYLLNMLTEYGGHAR